MRLDTVSCRLRHSVGQSTLFPVRADTLGHQDEGRIQNPNLIASFDEQQRGKARGSSCFTRDAKWWRE
jgi:hypothetical protein